jgi:hypothetical protein
MCNGAHMNNETRHYFANEVLSHSTDLDNIIVDKLHIKTRYERFGLPVPKWAEAEMGQIKIFGEAGVVKRGKGSKLQDIGVPMMFVGYAENHAHDCCRMWNPATKQITETRDVIWLHRMYYQNDITHDIGAMPAIRFSDDHILSQALKIMYPQRANNLQPTAEEMGGSDPVLNQKDLEDKNLISIQELPGEGSILEHREGDSIENNRCCTIRYRERII